MLTSLGDSVNHATWTATQTPAFSFLLHDNARDPIALCNCGFGVVRALLSSSSSPDQQQQLPSTILFAGTSLMETAELIAFLELASTRRPKSDSSSCSSSTVFRDAIRDQQKDSDSKSGFAVFVRLVVPAGDRHLRTILAILGTVDEESRLGVFIRNHVEIISLLSATDAASAAATTPSFRLTRVSSTQLWRCHDLSIVVSSVVSGEERNSNSDGLSISLSEESRGASSSPLFSIAALAFVADPFFDASRAFRISAAGAFCVVPLLPSFVPKFADFLAALISAARTEQQAGASLAARLPRFVVAGAAISDALLQRKLPLTLLVAPPSAGTGSISSIPLASLKTATAASSASSSAAQQLRMPVFGGATSSELQQNSVVANSTDPLPPALLSSTDVSLAGTAVLLDASCDQPQQQQQQQQERRGSVSARVAPVVTSSSASVSFDESGPDVSNIVAVATKQQQQHQTSADPAARRRSSDVTAGTSNNAAAGEKNEHAAAAAVADTNSVPSSSAVVSANASVQALGAALDHIHTPTKQQQQQQHKFDQHNDASTQTPPLSRNNSPEKTQVAQHQQQQPQAQAQAPEKKRASSATSARNTNSSNNNNNNTRSSSSQNNTPLRHQQHQQQHNHHHSAVSSRNTSPNKTVAVLPAWRQQLALEKLPSKVFNCAARVFVFSNEDKGLPGRMLMLRSVRTLEQLKQKISDMTEVRPIGDLHVAVNGSVVQKLSELQHGDEIVAVLHGGLPYDIRDPPRLLVNPPSSVEENDDNLDDSL